MGSGSWSSDKFASYTRATKSGATIDSSGAMRTSMSNQEMFKSRSVDPLLNPRGVVRECVDSDEHPNTIPVILALDVTGSMGEAAVEVAKELNVIMTKLYEDVKDIEFMIMGIGDLAYDDGPIQASQFESDIRIAEQLDKIWFEFGGGGNSYESYTAAWYFGLHHTKLDCWKRGKKGIIITMGDELPNPYLPASPLGAVLGGVVQGDVATLDLYNEVKEKFDIYHIDVHHRHRLEYDEKMIFDEWRGLLGDNFVKSNLNRISDDIISVICKSCDNTTTTVLNESSVNSSEGISW